MTISARKSFSAFIALWICIAASEAVPDDAHIDVRTITKIDIAGYDRLITNIEGLVATVSNAPNALFAVPDGRNFGASCQRMVKDPAYQSCPRIAVPHLQGMQAAACECQRSDDLTSNHWTCSKFGLTDHWGKPLDFPLHTLEEWNKLVPGGLKINANWFDVTRDNVEKNFPHVSVCSTIYGLSADNGTIVTKWDVGTPTNLSMPPAVDLLDALVVLKPETGAGQQRQIRIVANGNVAAIAAQVDVAVGGFIIMKNRKIVDPPASAKAKLQGARSGIGLSADGKTMYAVVVQSGPGNARGVTASELALYLRQLGAQDAINLDNSGSSQMLYDDGPGTFMITTAGDTDQNGRTVYRPIPNFLQIRVTPEPPNGGNQCSTERSTDPSECSRCLNNGWRSLRGADGRSFADEASCTSYAGQGGLTRAASLQVEDVRLPPVGNWGRATGSGLMPEMDTYRCYASAGLFPPNSCDNIGVRTDAQGNLAMEQMGGCQQGYFLTGYYLYTWDADGKLIQSNVVDQTTCSDNY